MTSKELFEDVIEYVILDDSDDAISDFEDDLRYRQFVERLDLLDWLAKNIYAAVGMMEMKKCAPHNVPNPFRAKYCNAIPIVDKDYDKYYEILRDVQRGLKND